jgi:hypothetical protein
MTAASNELRQHPLSAAFPSMPANEIEALAMDIEKHGQRDAGVLYEGMVLDGWHRYLACEKASVKFRSIPFEGGDPVAFVIAKNLHRRHLTASQRAACVVAASEWRPAGRPEKGEPGSPFRTNGEMAHAAEVTERTIQHAKVAHDAGLGEAVKAGEVSAKRAAEVAKLPKAKRAAALKESKPPKEKKPTVIAADPKFEKLYGEVKAKLEEVMEQRDALADTAESVEAFKDNEQFKQMEALRIELRAVKRRRDELMTENAELRGEVKRWRKKAEAKK